MTGHLPAGSLSTGALGLHTDLYELRMVESYLRAGMTAEATFSLYVRPSAERAWYVALGMHRVAEFLEGFRFGDEELDYLRSLGFRDATLAYLGDIEASGTIVAVPDGAVVLGDEPLVEVTGPLPFAQLIETAVINLVQFPTLVATKAARIGLASGSSDVVDFGFRRAHGLETGIEAALAAYVGAGMATSNVEAGRRFGIPVVGTMAHSYVQAYREELDAFRAFAADHPDNAVLLVDTYDTLEGVQNAIRVADEGHALRGVRLDSGDLDALSRSARRLLDEAGYADVQIFASGGLNEFRIRELTEAGAPIDAYGVGTDLVVSMDRPAVDIAYKLVAYDGRDVAKRSEGKETLPGAKQIFRTGGPQDDVLGLRSETLDGTPLLGEVWRDGRTTRAFDPETARERVVRELDALPHDWAHLPTPEQPPRPALSAALAVLA